MYKNLVVDLNVFTIDIFDNPHQGVQNITYTLILTMTHKWCKYSNL